MKFCDKLQKLRKEKNMSQEQLADRCDVSRQAVSKWESGKSYPDMDKIMQLCKILECNLDDLIDDAAFGNNSIPTKNKKVTMSTYLKEFLDFITKSVNMFWSMRWKERIKCILELVMVIAIIAIVFTIIGELLFENLISPLMNLIPYNVVNIFGTILRFIYSLFGIVIGAIILIHIFKIRYLDYFVTIEDSSVKDKTIEEPLDEEKKSDDKRVFLEKKKNKIIIRDPKHSTYNFFYILAKIALLLFKGCLILATIPLIICFIFIVFLAISSIWFIKDGVFFIGLSIVGVGACLLGFFLLRIIYDFVFSQTNNFKKTFIIFMCSLLCMGIGAGISFCTYLGFSDDSKDYVVNHYTVKIDDKVIMDFIFDLPDVNIVVDDNLDTAVLDIKHAKENKVIMKNNKLHINNEVYNHYYFDMENNPIDAIKTILDSIKHKKRVLDVLDYDITIHISSSDLEKLKQNRNEF